MPSIATHFKVLEKTTERLLNSAHPSERSKGDVMRKHLAYAYLGAIGPDLAQYIPSDPTENPLMDLYTRTIKSIINAYPSFKAIQDFIKKVKAAADAQDIEGLKNLKSEYDTMWPHVLTLKSVHHDIYGQSQAIMKDVLSLEPVIQKDKMENLWRPRDFMHWRHTGDFAQQLLEMAKQEQDSTKHEQLMAFAYGYLTHIATDTVGYPFCNRIVGGPVRLHWWRHRYAQNYIDTWVYGYYETKATMVGDTPNPGYDQWKDLCSASLHKEIDLGMGGPLDPYKVLDWTSKNTFEKRLPPHLSRLLMNSFTRVYGVLSYPNSITEEAWNNAYLVTYSFLWFSTGGEGLACFDPSSIQPPNPICGQAPSWVSGQGSPPQQSSPPTKSNPAAKTCSILLAILSALAFLAGLLAAGFAALGGAIGAALAGEDIDWEKVQCDIFWLEQYVYNNYVNALLDYFYNVGWIYPKARELNEAFDQDGNSLIKAIDPRSYPRLEDHRQSPGPDLNFIHYPDVGLENPATIDWLEAGGYPDIFIDSPANPLQGGGMIQNGAFPFRMDPSGRPVSFGNAVDNAMQLISNDAKGLPNYNLDGDRGYGWKCWQPGPNTYVSKPPYVPIPES